LQENIPIEEVFEQLKCTREIFGPNKLEEKKVTTGSTLHIHSFGLIYICIVCDANVLVVLCCVGEQNSQVPRVHVEPAVVGHGDGCHHAIALANGGGKAPNSEDFVGIIILLVINSTISFIEGESFCRTFEVKKFQEASLVMDDLSSQVMASQKKQAELEAKLDLLLKTNQGN
jgi:hypothetical protein